MNPEFYNLLEENWIPVLYHNGVVERIGIYKIFEDAHKIRQIATSNPMDRLAILRFLLALLYWCKGNPQDEENYLSIKSFPSEWFSKLWENKDNFNLLGNGKRFYQTESVRNFQKSLSVNYLIHEIPTGSNFWHFCHSLDGVNGLCPACCAMGLLRLPLFSTSAGKGKSPGINLKPPLYSVQVGSSLAETLLLSWRKLPEPNLGIPAWEKPDLELPKSGKIPILTGLTWLPRRVWLLENPQEKAKCISCGRDEHLIKKCIFAGRGSMKPKSGEKPEWNDPHVIRDDDGKNISPASAGDPEEALKKWAEITKKIVENPEKRKFWIISFATEKNDKYLEATEYNICLPEIDNFMPLDKSHPLPFISKLGSNIKSKKEKAVFKFLVPHIKNHFLSRPDKMLIVSPREREQIEKKEYDLIKPILEPPYPGHTLKTILRRSKEQKKHSSKSKAKENR